MFSSHATESSAAITAASSFSAFSHSAIAARFSALGWPAYSSPWTIAGASDGAGRSCHTLSTGLPWTATSFALRFASSFSTALAQPFECSHAS